MHAYRIHLRLGRLAAPASHSLRTMRYVKTRQGMSKQDEACQNKDEACQNKTRYVKLRRGMSKQR